MGMDVDGGEGDGSRFGGGWEDCRERLGDQVGGINRIVAEGLWGAFLLAFWV